METRPTVFIGSSREGLPVAEAIQQNLDFVSDATLWSQGVFGLGQGTLESLVDRLKVFDFAILVLTPDDIVVSREIENQSPRDNVLLELGMFIGSIGRERTFIVHDRSRKLKLPSDLAGVTSASFQTHADGNLQSSVGAAVTLIKAAITKHGKRKDKLSIEIDPHTHFQVLHDLLEPAPEQFLIWMLEKGQSINCSQGAYSFGINYEFCIKDVKGGSGGFRIGELCRKLPDAELLQIDLRQNVMLTDRGKKFAQWLIENGHKADFFKSDIGGWGDDLFFDWRNAFGTSDKIKQAQADDPTVS